MKTLRLVSRGAKVSCIICAVVIAAAGIAWIALRFSVGALLAFLAAAAQFAVYVYIVFSSKAEYVPDSGILRLCGMQSAEIPLEGVVSVSSREVTVHGTVSRVIVLLGSGGAELAAMPGICGGRGYAAEQRSLRICSRCALTRQCQNTSMTARPRRRTKRRRRPPSAHLGPQQMMKSCRRMGSITT